MKHSQPHRKRIHPLFLRTCTPSCQLASKKYSFVLFALWPSWRGPRISAGRLPLSVVRLWCMKTIFGVTPFPVSTGRCPVSVVFVHPRKTGCSRQCSRNANASFSPKLNSAFHVAQPGSAQHSTEYDSWAAK